MNRPDVETFATMQAGGRSSSDRGGDVFVSPALRGTAAGQGERPEVNVPMRQGGTAAMALDGVWYNELNSTMILEDDGAGNLRGTYESRVGVPLGPCRLVGRYDTGRDAPGTALGFVVVWQTQNVNANATTSWAGQYQVVDGEEQIFTMWLLSIVNNEDTDWNSIEVGQDVFLRAERSEAEVARFRGKRAASHPLQ